MSDIQKVADSKKPYEAPRLAAISLRPEEAVLGHCKIVGSSGPTNHFGACDVSILGCHTLGS